MTYNAVKAAEISLAKSMAQQLARDNIRVNSVAPGSILFPGGSWHRRSAGGSGGIADS
jgi:3-oxoacyl-[acyl-carrier protein] reductase